VDFPDKSAGPNKPPQVGPVAPREKKEPIIAGAAKVKRPITRRFFSGLLAETPRAAAARIGQEVLIPQMKMGLEAAVHAFISNMFWSSGYRPPSAMVQKATLLGKHHINYSNPSGISSQQSQHPQQQITSAREQSTGKYEDVRCPTLPEAQKLLTQMLAYLQEYPVVTVADLYEWAEITPAVSDNSFGWTDLSEARIVPGRGGFILEMPRPTIV
jgi:hypothetical protein